MKTKNERKIIVIGAPFLYGKDNKSHSEAPNVLRESGLHKAFEIAQLNYEDKGNISLTKTQLPIKTNLKCLNEIVEITKTVAKEIHQALLMKHTPILLGGDNSITIGALLGVASTVKDVGLVYLDTHGDFHTSQTTPSGRLHGMALAISLGLDKNFLKYYGSKISFFSKNKTVLFGGQKFDPGERETIEKNISLIDINFIDQYGIGKAVEKLISQLKTKKIYISLDLDVIDKLYAPGTDMSIDGALSYREIIYTLEKLSEKYDIIGMDVTEMSPKKDTESKTANIAIECITTALGHRIGAYELYMDKLTPIDK